MIPTLTINNVNFAEWAKESGIQISPIYRRQKSVVAQDGTEYRASKRKWQFQINILDINETTLQILLTALTGANPAAVTENLTSGGGTRNRTCYITDYNFSPKRVKGGKTDYTGLSVTLEER